MSSGSCVFFGRRRNLKFKVFMKLLCKCDQRKSKIYSTIELSGCDDKFFLYFDDSKMLHFLAYHVNIALLSVADINSIKTIYLLFSASFFSRLPPSSHLSRVYGDRSSCKINYNFYAIALAPLAHSTSIMCKF